MRSNTVRGIPLDGQVQGLCYWCGVARSDDIDHLTPRSRGGTDDPANLVLACRPCNAQKGAKTEAEYRAWLAAR